ncbi:hypothetical protein D4764_19G0007010 [Takifugu flavidus]|uniref:Uncharacterized protein n=1 Tax=Takifugu flavidus TaxID=433684 RepID=A0A5C6NNW3_9TELE|nr:hypothetical protein D4764_19G0007010 [Takifugu flavidus]
MISQEAAGSSAHLQLDLFHGFTHQQPAQMEHLQPSYGNTPVHACNKSALIGEATGRTPRVNHASSESPETSGAPHSAAFGGSASQTGNSWGRQLHISTQKATGRLRLADRLSSGVLGFSGLCRSGVRTKFGIDMVLLGEPGITRSPKEGCTGPATGRLRLADRLSSGVLGYSGLCRSGVRTKFGIDMVLLGEPGITRSPKEGCTGPGRKRSRSKPPCRSVVGSRP